MKRFLICTLAVGFLAAGAAAMVNPADIVAVSPRYASDRVIAGSGFQVALELQLAEGWHINTDAPSYEFAIPTELVLDETPGISVGEIVYPPPSGLLNLPDGGTTEIYSGTVHVIIRGRLDEGLTAGEYPLTGLLSFQGCNDETCLRPAEKEFSFSLSVAPPGTLLKPKNGGIFNAASPASDGPDSVLRSSGGDPSEAISSIVEERGLAVTLILVFFGGLALNLTPCVYPLIPITISYFGGRQGGGSPVPSAFAYLLGICLMYSALGTMAAVTGKMFGALLTNPIVLVVLASFMVLLALSMFGLFEFRLPTAIMNIGGSARKGVAGALLMGMTMGIVAAPCVGPFVIGLLTYVATLGSPLKGFLLFFLLSLGLGLPYLVLGIFSGRISALPRAGEWMIGVRRIFGVVLVAMAVYFVNPLLGDAMQGLVLGLVLILGGTFLAVVDRSGAAGTVFHTIKGLIAVGLIVGGTWLVKPAPPGSGLPWAPYSAAALEEAAAMGRPVVIDFFADWCIPCKELDKLTFTDRRVLAFSTDFVFLKADLTVEEGETTGVLKETYGIQGVPTIVFLDAGGTEFRDLRLTGFEKAELFAGRLEEALTRSGKAPAR